MSAAVTARASNPWLIAVVVAIATFMVYLEGQLTANATCMHVTMIKGMIAEINIVSVMVNFT